METLQRTANRGSVSTGGYEIDNSLKLEDDNEEGMVKNFTGDGDRRTWTYSTWIKRTELGGDAHHLFGASYSTIQFMSNDLLRVALYDGSNTRYADLDRVFRDTSAWYHIIVVLDSTQSTAADRVKIYINGVRDTDFDNNTYTNMSQNDEFGFGSASANYQFGYNFVGGANDRRFNGYVAETHYVNGTALDETSFGEFDNNGIWIPKEYTGSHGSKGFYLKFDDSSNLGKDSASSGIGDFSLTNITAADQATDTPTNNFCTLNLQVPTYVNTGGALQGGTFIDWGQNHYGAWFGTQGVKKGKWYWEFYVPSRSASYGLMNYIGLHTLESKQFGDGNTYASAGSNVVFLLMHYGDYYATTNGSLASQNTAAGGIPSQGTGAVGVTFSVAFNADDAEITYYSNGSVIGNSGIDVFDIDESMAAGNFVFPFFQVYDNDLNVNFGGYSSVAISSGNSDANGYGNFEYSVPSGYYALCTKNLAEFG